MSRLPLHIHVAEPWTFERGNGTCELMGSTEDHARPGCEDWRVRLERTFTLDDREYDEVTISPRYFGETLHRLGNALVNVVVNIVPVDPHATDDEQCPAMVGTVVQRRG